MILSDTKHARENRMNYATNGEPMIPWAQQLTFSILRLLPYQLRVRRIVAIPIKNLTFAVTLTLKLTNGAAILRK